MPTFHEGQQGSAIWLKQRAGHATASRMNDVFDITLKGAEGAKRRKYKLELVTERLTGQITDSFVSNAMINGITLEPSAREEYEIRTGELVQQVGFCTSDTIKWLGCSVDGLLSDGKGLIEIKCCLPHNHLEIVLTGMVPDQFKKQIIACCLITERSYCDFIAYSDVLPEPLNLFIKRFEPTAAEIIEVETAAKLFLDEVEAMFEQITIF